MALTLSLGATAHAQTTAEVRQPPVATVTLNIPAPAAGVEAQALPTEFVKFQSKLSNDAKDQLEGWIWRPTNVDAFAKVPVVLVFHGHAGAGTYQYPATQYRTLGKLITSHGAAMILVNSFTQVRNDYIVAKYGAAYTILPGLSDYRTNETSDTLARPWDVAGALAYVKAGNLPWADTGHVIGVGHSHGATALMAATMSNHPVNLNSAEPGGRGFEKAFLTYPGCGMGGLSQFKNSASLIPSAVIGVGTADSFAGNCSMRQYVSTTVAATNPTLKPYELWLYAGATHTWESTAGVANAAAKADWRGKLVTYLDGLKH